MARAFGPVYFSVNFGLMFTSGRSEYVAKNSEEKRRIFSKSELKFLNKIFTPVLRADILLDPDPGEPGGHLLRHHRGHRHVPQVMMMMLVMMIMMLIMFLSARALSALATLLTIFVPSDITLLRRKKKDKLTIN